MTELGTTAGTPNGVVQLSPWEAGRRLWRDLCERSAETTLYHGEPWVELLRQTYDFEIYVASMGGAVARAGALLARTKPPWCRMLGLPFSDECPPLAPDPHAGQELLRAIATAGGGRPRYEIRGTEAPAPWRLVRCYEGWTLELNRSLKSLEKSSDRNFRRNLRRGLQTGTRIDCASGPAEVERFYRLHLETRRRLGVLPQPLRMFELVQRIFAPRNELEVWLASSAGRDLAGAVVLRARDGVYIKWAARRADGPAGANHLLFWSVVECHAANAPRIDLGRADSANLGLSRFKRELGARPTPLPYAFLPAPPRRVSVEVSDGPLRLLRRCWRWMPLAVTRAMGAAVYRYLA